LTNIVAISNTTGERTAIIDRARAARFVAPGTLVFVRDGRLMAASFDVGQLKIVGQPVALDWRVEDDVPQFAVSRVGSVIIAPSLADEAPPLALVSRDGRLAAVPPNVQHLASPSLSADGRRLLAVARNDVRADIWSAEIDRGALTRLTFDGEHRSPMWTANRRLIVFSARTGGPFNLFVSSVDGSSLRRVAPAIRQQTPTSVSADGSSVTFTQFDPDAGADIWSAPLDGGHPSVLIRTPFDETAGALSPDGRWLAYQSNQSNRWEVYARAIPTRGAPVPISTGGGTSPVWTRDGGTVYYSSATGLMAVDVQRDGCGEGETSCDLAPSRPVEILRGAWTPRGATPDGRILVERRQGHELADHLVITLQWTRELQRLVPPPVVSSPK
jgi:serine/threonine-protein kinase